MQQVEKILIIGSGAREHAIGWKLKQSPRVKDLYFAPGNAGTANIGINVNIKATEIDRLVDFVKKEKIDLTLAVPDDPLSLGVVDSFKKEKLRIWGPTKDAAKLEWSKAHAKNFMKKYGLPTANYGTFNAYDKALPYLERQQFPIVIKASGLALGKGVLICKDMEEAKQALEDIFVNKVFGEAGEEIVIEEFIEGVEISTHAFSDGKSYKIFPASQDHKRVGEGDTGLNTGGMGTIAPLPFVNEPVLAEIEEKIMKKTLAGIAEEGSPFIGIIYPGLMLTDSGAKILEYNARFGDPETETYMRLLDTDLLDIIEASVDGNLAEVDVNWKDMYACTIMLASMGYPEQYEKGKAITGIQNAEQDKDIVVFHAGTTMKDNILVTNGGRVLGVSAIGNTLEEALEKAYGAIKKINFEGMQYRKDIGKKALEMLK